MVHGLKLQDVVSRAHLIPRTARYVLSHGGLDDLPLGDGKGRHRIFGFEQAVRLALATQLAMNGVPLEAAADATRMIEQTVASRTRSAKGASSLYESSVTDPWVVRVLDGRYIQVWRNRGHHLFGEDDFFSIVDRKQVNYFGLDLPVSEAKINLTWMEMLLKRAF